MVRTEGEDADEQKVIDDIEQYGWHIVGIEADDEGPGFAYSVGLHHTLGHPEVIVFGLASADTMAQIINGIGDAVRSGTRFEDWHESDEILEGYSCMFRKVPIEAYPEYLGYAMWFYRPDQFPVLQCVWPDKEGRYPWEAECDPIVRQRQPVLAIETDWPFLLPKNRAVITTCRVLDGTHPIMLVSHDEDGNWQFLCGTTNDTKDGRVVCLGTIVELCPSVVEVADLPLGWQARRESEDSEWTRSKLR